jgi:hypothetical protein
MRPNLAAKAVLVFFFILLSFGRITAQPAPCAHDFFCLFNQEAAASDTEGIRSYSHDMIELIVPAGAGKGYINSLSDRMARAESAVRNGRGRLVPEVDVVRSFNEIMRTIGAPPTFMADVASMRRFRARSATVPSFSALFTANRNGTNCNPGEAVLLLFLLIENDGALSEHMFDEYAPSQAGVQEKRLSVLTGGMEAHRNVKWMLFDYSSRHRRGATIKLFDRAVHTLGF